MTKRSQTLVPSAVLGVLLSVVVPGLAAAVPLSAGVSFTATDQGFTDFKSRMTGWQFTVGINPIKVTELGYQDFGVDGLLASHQVGIWRLSDQFLINSVVVPNGTSGTLNGHFRYAALASPSTLISGETYLISGLDSGFDSHVWDAEIGVPNSNMDVSGFSVDSAITIGAAGTAHGPFQASFGFPTTLGVPDARTALMGPNLRFAVVPEPSTFVNMGLGLIGLAGYGWRRKRKLTA